jgi:hypothetical protein
MNDSGNKKALKSYLTSKLNDYSDSTFAKMDYSMHDKIIRKHKSADKAGTLASLELKLKKLQQNSDYYKYALLLISIITALLIVLSKALSKIEFILMTSICFVFLILGLILPMIEIDARLSEIKLSLLGEDIGFKEQLLYYKSKSILEVVKLMLFQGSFDLMLVGLLVLLFSVLFPMSKIAASVSLILNPNLKSNKIINFMVYKTGKWSMADVFVVAIFMSYIGFSGILTEQLNQIENLSSKIDILSTNNSSLQNGFFAFTAFAILSLLITNGLQNSINPKLKIAEDEVKSESMDKHVQY